MKGKVCLVTGATSGVGKSVTYALAKSGAAVVMVSRDIIKAGQLKDEIILNTKNNNIYWLQADLGSQQSIRNLVDIFRKKFNRLDVLSNNAGILQIKREETIDGIEKTFAVEYLSHFLLTNLLVDLLIKSKPSRVITVAGAVRELKRASINLDEIQFKEKYNFVEAKLQAGLCRVLFTNELAEKVKGSGVTCNAFHPGFIKSGMVNNLPLFLKWPAKALNLFLSTDSKTAIYMATSPEIETITGKLFIRKKPYDFFYDKGITQRLWSFSMDLTNLK